MAPMFKFLFAPENGPSAAGRAPAGNSAMHRDFESRGGVRSAPLWNGAESPQPAEKEPRLLDRLRNLLGRPKPEADLRSTIEDFIEDAEGKPGFETLQTYGFAAEGDKTRLTVKAEVIWMDDRMAPAIAGMEPGWEQTLEKLDAVVAELGSAFVAAQLGLNIEPRSDHAAYIACWLRVLRGDARAILTASAKAQEAADFLIACSEGEGARPAEYPAPALVRTA